MKKRYLITALITGVALTDVTTISHFAQIASANMEKYNKQNISKNKEKQTSEHNYPSYKIKLIIAKSNGKDDLSTSFETQIQDMFYSLQFGVFKDEKSAEKFLGKLPDEIKENAFIYKTDNGMFAVRYGLFDNYKLLKEIQQKLPVNSIIVRSDASKVILSKVAPAKVSEKKNDKKEIKTSKTKEVIREETTELVPEFEEEEINIFEEEKPSIPLYKKIIGAVFFIPAYMLTHKQRGFWGKIEFSYRNETYDDPYRKTTRNSFRQYYELNYEGFIYSPRLLTYRLGGNFTREDSKIKTGGNTSDSTSKLTGYNLEINLLKDSRYPFNLFARKSQSPLWYTYYDRTSYVERKSDSYGFFGSVRLPASNINYGYKHTKSTSQGLDFSEDRKFEEYLFSYSKGMVNQSFNITYRRTTDDYIQRYLTYGNTRIVNQDIDNLTMNYKYRVSKEGNIIANGRYYSNSYSSIKNYTGNINYYWSPSDKLNATLGTSATYSESPGYNLKFFTINENVAYKLSKNWNLNQNLIMYYSSGNQSDQKLINTNINLNYHKEVSETLSVHGGTGVSGQAETGNIDRVGGTLSLSGGLVKKFSFMDSSISLSGSASQYNSSKNDKSTTYNINERFYAFLSQNLQFEHTINYYYQDSQYYSSGSEFSSSKYDNLEVSNALRYKRLLGWKGTLSSTIGLKYYYGKNRAERVYPYGNLNITYKFTRRLLYKMRLDVHRDTYYNADYARISSSIDYKIRSLFFKLDFQYYYENSDYYGKRQNYITLVKVYRVF